MNAPPHLQHLPANLLGLSDESERWLASSRTEPQHALFVARQLSDFEADDSPSVRDALDPEERRHLVDRLEAAASTATHVRVLDSIRKAREPRASFVVTRVAPCLLGPRLADLLGVLQTLRLAAELTAFEKEPVLPLVWLQGDLPATEERFTARLLGPHHDLVEVKALDPLPAGESMGSLRPDPRRLPLLRAHLRQLMMSAPHRDQALGWLLPQEEESLCESTRRLLFELFGQEGLLVCGPDDFRADLAHELSQVVDSGRTLLQTLPAEETLCWDRRDHRALGHGGEGYRGSDEPGSRTGAELAAQIVQEPARFVAGPLLEPSLIRRFLPVRAWIGDRKEAAGEFHLRDLHEFERGRIGWVARWQATWVEKRDEEALHRLGWTLQTVLTNKNPLCDPLDHQKDPSEDLRLSAPQASIDALLAEFRDSAQPLVDLDASLAPLLRRQTRQAKAMLETFLERAERVLRNQGGTEERHRRRITNALRPAGRPSSEFFGPLPALAIHGPLLLEAVRNEIETFTFEHVAIFPR